MSMPGRLEDFSAVEVLGVVSPSGAGGARNSGESLWTFKFTLDAWRVRGGDLRTRPLRVSRSVSDQELDRLRGRIAPYAIVHIKAVVRKAASGQPEADLEEFVGVDESDAELNEHSAELQKPVTIEDEVFGTLTLDRSVDWFTADAIWDGRPVSLNLSESADVQKTIDAARELWRNQSDWNRRVREYAVQRLLPIKNESWLDEDESELTPDEFKERMTLEGITVSPDGSFDFWHNDGDLFYGHSIQVSGSLLEGLNHADIPG